MLIEVTGKTVKKIINTEYITHIDKCGKVGLIYLVDGNTLDDSIEIDEAAYEHLVQILNNRCGIFKI